MPALAFRTEGVAIIEIVKNPVRNLARTLRFERLVPSLNWLDVFM